VRKNAVLTSAIATNVIKPFASPYPFFHAVAIKRVLYQYFPIHFPHFSPRVWGRRAEPCAVKRLVNLVYIKVKANLKPELRNISLFSFKKRSKHSLRTWG